MSAPLEAPATALFIGGVRSGKSDLAQKWLEERCDAPVYVACGIPRDSEMRERAERHRRRRGEKWQTLESPLLESVELSPALGSGKGALVDCLSAWLANALERGLGGGEILRRFDEAFNIVASAGVAAAYVTAECGLGFAPLNSLARKYGDLLGELNQLAARRCGSVYFVSCGIAMPLKEGGAALGITLGG